MEKIKGGRGIVNFVWCKVCAKQKTEITSQWKGYAKTVVIVFISSTCGNKIPAKKFNE